MVWIQRSVAASASGREDKGPLILSTARGKRRRSGDNVTGTTSAAMQALQRQSPLQVVHYTAVVALVRSFNSPESRQKTR
jgi:hypothetical protein